MPKSWNQLMKRLMTARDRAQYLALTSLAGLGADALEVFEKSVRDATPEDVQRFASVYLNPDRLALAVILPKASRPPDYTGFPHLH